MRRLAVVLGVLVSTVAAVIAGLVGGSGSAGAALARPDLAVTVSVDRTELSPAGGEVSVAIRVRNAGSGPAADVTVKIRPPRGGGVAGSPTGNWRCDNSLLLCTYISPDGGLDAPLDAGADADPLIVPLTFPAASAGSSATVSATATTTTRETSTANNTGKATVQYTAVANLRTELSTVDTEWSTFGGRAYVSVLVANDGTAPVSDIRLTVTPPAGTDLWPDIFTEYGWTCELTVTPWVCTWGTLESGKSTGVTFPLHYPAGTDGDTATMTATASTTSPERSIADNSAQTGFRYVTPDPADIALTGLSVYPQQVVAGDQITIWVHVDNVGGSPADEVTVRLPLPDTVQPVSADGSGPDWTCTIVADAGGGQRGWECVHPRYEARGLELVSPIELVATVGAGTPAGTLTFTATASTTSPEDVLTNNVVEGSTNYQAQGFLSGHVWLDQDRDGQRDPEEPGVESGYGVQLMHVLAEGATGPSWDSPIPRPDVNGQYVQPLPPGRYFVQITVDATLDFTTPGVGDEATDSDVTLQTRWADGVRGVSEVVDVVDGAHAVVDIGLVPAQP